MSGQIPCVAAYSGGKDSALALWRGVQAGYAPQALLVACRRDAGRSWFHGIPEPLLHAISEAMDIPVHLVKSDGGEAYGKAFSEALAAERAKGARCCLFGDIDLPQHRQWNEEVCARAGMDAVMPLWGEERRGLVEETLRLGFKAWLTVVDTRRVRRDLLGRLLTPELMTLIESTGADACGENGEYHSFVADGPLFRKPVAFAFGEAGQNGPYSWLPLLPAAA